MSRAIQCAAAAGVSYMAFVTLIVLWTEEAVCGHRWCMAVVSWGRDNT